jgi:hypothetical protein
MDPGQAQRMSASQRFLFDRVQKRGRRRARELVARLSRTERAELRLAKDKLIRSPIVVNLNLHQQVFGQRKLIESILEVRRIFNMFEIEHAQMGSDPSKFRVRVMLEFKLYGGTKDLQPVLGGMSNTEHPTYGLVDYMDYPIGYSIVGFYGWYRFVLKHEVKQRTTFSPLDSMHIDNDQTFVWDDIDAVLATRVGEKQRYWFQYVNDRVIPFDSNGNVSYIEAQILGGVHLDKDMEALHHPHTDEFNQEMKKFLGELHTTFGFALEPY